MVAVAIIVLLLALIPILISQINSDNKADELIDTPDAGKILSGTYSISDGSVGYFGTSKYEFDGKNVKNTYTSNGETFVIDYTYVIAVENGAYVIKLTTTDENGESKTTTHDFYEGTDWRGLKFISINDAYYYLQENTK